MVSQLLDLEKQGGRLNDIVSFLDTDYESGKRQVLVTNMLSENSAPSEFNTRAMAARLYIEDIFGANSATNRRLIELSKGKGKDEEQSSALTSSNEAIRSMDQALKGGSTDKPLDLYDLFTAIKNKPSRIELVRTLVESGAGAEELSGPRLAAVSGINERFGDSSTTARQLLQLEKEGLALANLNPLLSDGASILEDAVRRGYSVNQMSFHNLADREYLFRSSSPFSTNELAYLRDMQEHGVSGNHLAQYIQEGKGEGENNRAQIIRALIAKQANPQRIKDQLSLIVLPDNVASKVADGAQGSGLSTAKIMGHLKDWKYGSKLRELIVERSNEPASIDRDEMLALVDRAKFELSLSADKINRSTDGTIADTTSSNDYVETHAPSSTDDAKANSTSSTIHTNTEASSIQSARFRTDLANTVLKAADAIESAIPPDRTIVLLGRDMWPLLPVLRERGRQTQYFMWSTKQETDANTLRQWNKEVPPNSAVIDTGFQGTIFDFIKTPTPARPDIYFQKRRRVIIRSF